MITIGKRCALYRKRVLRKTQTDVGNDIGFKKSNISAFETGRNDSSLILLWYLENGLTLDKLLGGDNEWLTSLRGAQSRM